MTRKVKPLIHLEQLEPRILLSGDSLLNIAPDPHEDTILDNTPQVVEYAELLDTHEPVEEQISLELTQPDTTNTDVCQPIFTLLADDDNTNDESSIENLSVDNIGPAQTGEVLAVLSNDSDRDIESKFGTTEDGSMPIYINDADLSAEYATSIEIRGPPGSNSLESVLTNTTLEDVALQAESSILEENASGLQTEGVVLPGLHLVDPSVNYFDGQIVYLDFDGEMGVTYNGPVIVEGINIPEFFAPGELAGQEKAIIADVVARVQEVYAGSGVVFTTEKPAPGQIYSTIFIGGDDSDFAKYGFFFGLAEQVDAGNQNPCDNAFVFSESIVSGQTDLASLAAVLADLVAHEIGHLLGYAHVDIEHHVSRPLHAVALEVKILGPSGTTLAPDTEYGFGVWIQNPVDAYTPNLALSVSGGTVMSYSAGTFDGIGFDDIENQYTWHSSVLEKGLIGYARIRTDAAGELALNLTGSATNWFITDYEYDQKTYTIANLTREPWDALSNLAESRAKTNENFASLYKALCIAEEPTVGVDELFSGIPESQKNAIQAVKLLGDLLTGIFEPSTAIASILIQVEQEWIGIPSFLGGIELWIKKVGTISDRKTWYHTWTSGPMSPPPLAKVSLTDAEGTLNLLHKAQMNEAAAWAAWQDGKADAARNALSYLEEQEGFIDGAIEVAKRCKDNAAVGGPMFGGAGDAEGEAFFEGLIVHLEGERNVIVAQLKIFARGLISYFVTPQTPAGSTPADEVNTLTPLFQWSSFLHGGDEDTQAGYQLRVRCDTDGDVVVYDTGFIPDTSSHSHTYSPGTYTGYDAEAGVTRVSEPLEPGKYYHWHVRYRDDSGNWSHWSNDTPETHLDFYVNIAPVIAGLPDRNLYEDSSLDDTIDLWLCTWDGETPDNGLTFSIVSNTNPDCGVSIDGNRYIDISPAADWSGTSDVTIQVSDGYLTDTDEFRITVSPVNDIPLFTKGSDVVVNEDSGSYTEPNWAGNISPGPPNESSQTVSFNMSNDNNSLFSAQPAINNDGTLTFTPTPNTFGSAIVTVIVQDDGGMANGGQDTSAPQTFRIIVNPVNDNPDAVDDYYDVDQDSGANVLNVLGNDTYLPDLPETLAITDMTNGSYGNVVIINSGTQVTYTPNPGYSGPDSFTYKIEDGNGGSDWATVDISVQEIQEAVATPTFDPDGGTYTSPVDVTISCTTPGVTIHYTTNGATPTESDPVYTAPINISSTTTLKAKAFKTDWLGSEVKSADYIITGSVDLISPNGSETWYVGETHDITWAAAGVSGNVKIYFSTDSGATYPNDITTVPATDSSYAWTIPDVNSTHCRVQVQEEGGGVSDESDADFTIVPQVVVIFPDANLEAAIRGAINKPTGDIYYSDVETLTRLYVQSKGISDLSGLEYCTNLTHLDLGDNRITSITALSGLTRLRYVLLGLNPIADISPLSDLTNLFYLSLGYCEISNLEPLSSLVNLAFLSLGGNHITDISSLSGLTSLSKLHLSNNQIAEISTISELANLTMLNLGGNQITDISALLGLTNLSRLILYENQISDIGALVLNPGLSEGDFVDLSYNWLDLSPGTQASQDLQMLQDRGVTVNSDNQFRGAITGTVTRDTDGLPISGLWLYAYDYDTGNGGGSDQTDVNGVYEINVLAGGIYRVYINTSATDYIAEYYNDVLDYDSATPVAVTGGQETPDINFGLAIYGRITGTVTRDSDGAPISGLRVYAHDYDTDQWRGSTYTDENGVYEIAKLPGGTYRLQVVTYNTDYIAEYYNNVLDYDGATPVAVTGGQETSDINFGLAIYGRITGTVTRDSDGAPISGLRVYAHDYDTDQWRGSTYTDENGVYEIAKLPGGTYRLQVVTYNTDYIAEYYNDVLDYDGATPVAVTLGQETPDINFGLAIYGRITGTVTRDSDGAPTSGLWVYANDYNTDQWRGSTYTDENGFYEIKKLPAGTYRVRVNTYDTEYIAEYYNDVLDYDSATLVAVNEGEQTSGIDFELAIGGSISGCVTDVNGIPLANVGISLLQGTDPYIADEHAWEGVAWTSTDSNGEYQLIGLAERRYRIHIHSQEVSGTHYFEADLYNVQVFEEVETPNMNLALRQAGLIYGYVKTADGIPMPNAEVVSEAAWTEYGNEWHSAVTDSEGKYEFWVAPSPGKFYPVYVRKASLGGVYYESKWDGNFYQATLEGTRVPDYQLELGGTVTGYVVNEDSVGIEDVRVQSEWNKYGIDDTAYDDTDSDGYFELGGLPTGINYIYLCNSWREIEQDGVKYMVGDAFAGPINATAGGTVDVGTFTIYKAGMVTGVITDQAGFPVVGAELDLEGQDIEGNSAGREEVVTDAFGQFTIDYVAPGTYILTCEKDGFIMGLETDIVIGRGEHVDIDGVLKNAAEGAIISGCITNYFDVAAYDSENGVYYPYYEKSYYEDFGLSGFGLLSVSMERDYTECDYLDIDKFFIGFVDENRIDDGYGDYFQVDTTEIPGNYSMVLPSGDVATAMYVYQQYLPGWGGCAVVYDWKCFNLAKGDVRDDVDFTAVTTNTGTLKGDITVPAGYDYSPGDWCSIYAYVLDDSGHTETAIPVGDAVAFPGCTTTYEFRNLPTGKYMLKAYARDLASVIVPSVTVTASETTMQDIVLTSGGTLAGQVTDGVNGISGATVTIEETGRQAATEDAGSYTIIGISTGAYTVKVDASGYADAEAAVSITAGSTTILDFILNATVGSISGTVKTADGNEINGATVLGYNETDKTFDTAETVGGAFSITELTPGEYILAVETVDYGVVVYPSDGSRITLSPQQDITGMDIVVDIPKPPVFTVHSIVTTDGSVTLSMEFHSEPNLVSEPFIAVVPGTGNGFLGVLTSNPALNRFEIDYTVDVFDDIVQIEISEANPIVPGNPASKTFTFEVSSNLVQTSSTNVTNAMGGKTKIMGTQDNTGVYVPPFAIAGASDTQALTLTIERYGDPGDAVPGTTATSVSAVYDFEFDEGGVSIDVDHTFTVTMSFQLPEGMSPEAFEDSLEIRYFDAGDQQWKTDGISNVRINWASSTITFDVNHLTKFAAFVNEAPVANNDTYTTDEDTVLNIDAPGVLWNDNDIDGDPLLSAVRDTTPTYGSLTLNADGSFSYTPNPDFNGIDNFTYHANDGVLDSNIATVTITVNAVNDTPQLDAGSDQSVNESQTVNLTTTFTDPDLSDTHTATVDWGDGIVEPGVVDELACEVSSSHVYADDDIYIVTVIVTDNNGAFGEDDLTITVSNVAPQITAVSLDSATIDENGTVALSGSFTDPGKLDTHKVEINWGDGQSSPATVNQAAGTFDASHQYLDDTLPAGT